MIREIGNSESGDAAKNYVLSRGSAMVVMNLASTALTFLIAVVLARSLGDSQYGIYAFVMAWVGLLTIPAGLGLPALVTRESARHSQANDWGLVKGIIRFGALAILGVSVVCLLVVPVITRAPVMQAFDHPLVAVLLGMAILPLTGWSRLMGSAGRGLGQVVWSSFPVQVLQPLLFLVLAGILFWRFEPAVVTALAGSAVSWAIVLVVVTLIVLRSIPGQQRQTPAVMTPRVWLRNSMFFMVSGGGFYINSRADVLMLGFFESPEKLGAYNVAARTATILGIALSATAAAIAPRVVRYYRENNTRDLQSLLSSASRLAFAVTLPQVLIVLVFGSTLLAWVFGPEYREGYLPLVILSLSQLASVGFGSVGMVLNMTGHERLTATGVWVGATFNIVANLCLIPLWGITGAAIATASSILVWNGLLYWLVRRRLRIDPSIFARHKVVAG